MDKETTYFVKFRDQVLGPMNKTTLIAEISQGSIPKSALWSANQLLWTPLSTVPGLFVQKIVVKSLEEPKTGVFLSTKTNWHSPTDAHNQGTTPLQWALILGGGGVVAMLVLVIIVVWSTDSNKRDLHAQANGPKIREINKPDVEKKKAINQKAKDPVQAQVKKGNQNNNPPKKDEDNGSPEGGVPVVAAKKEEDKEIPKEPVPIAAAKKEEGKVLPEGGVPVVAAKKEEAKYTSEEIFDLHAPSVAQIFVGKGDGIGKGSGFLVANGLLVTNDHVVNPLEVGHQVWAIFHSAKGMEAKGKIGTILKRVPKLDLAFVSVNSDLPSLELAPKSHFKPGRLVVAIGSPGIEGDSLPNTIAQGVIGQIIHMDLKAMLQISISINKGNSGGPVIDPYGKVVGVITLKAIKQEGIALCVPSDQVTDELKKLSRK